MGPHDSTPQQTLIRKRHLFASDAKNETHTHPPTHHQLSTGESREHFGEAKKPTSRGVAGGRSIPTHANRFASKSTTIDIRILTSLLSATSQKLNFVRQQLFLFDYCYFTDSEPDHGRNGRQRQVQWRVKGTCLRNEKPNLQE